MWKWLICKLWGTSCVWHTIHTVRYQRDAYGVYLNAHAPRILCETHTQKCVSCGEIRTREVQLPT
jgi:hypothetical protein